ncbi:ribonuclease H-like domain-containing protein [Tanacetum coccineum]|uniref:Ribonuclease H-like domain-containing protein n=1 Tax=Tanacetum coccineum TaxID=301880 RepID=A0ABQ5GPM9_9ASTR
MLKVKGLKIEHYELENPQGLHQRTKHIEIDIHFVRDLVVSGQVRVLHVPSCYQFANIFTKGLPSALFEEFRTSLSVRRVRHLAVTAWQPDLPCGLTFVDLMGNIKDDPNSIPLSYSILHSRVRHLAVMAWQPDLPCGLTVRWYLGKATSRGLSCQASLETRIAEEWPPASRNMTSEEGCKSIPTVELEFLGQTKRMNLKCFITYVVRNVLSIVCARGYNETVIQKTSTVTRKLTNVGTHGTYAVRIKNPPGISVNVNPKVLMFPIRVMFRKVELSPVQCLITDVRDVACGNDFTVWLTSLKGASIILYLYVLLLPLLRKIPRTCSSVADWLRISSGSYAAGGIYHGRPLVHMLIGLIGSIPSD